MICRTIVQATGARLFYGIKRYGLRSFEGISPGAPIQAALRANLDAVLAEQDDHARMAGGE